MFFDGFDFTDFWYRPVSEDRTTAPPFTVDDLRRVEAELGYKLPASYVWMMRHQRNGGTPQKTYYAVDDNDAVTVDEVSIEQIYGIGFDGDNTLCGDYGTKFWLEVWEYPPIGVVIADTESAGHELIFLDYRQCGPDGEPCVTYIDQELGDIEQFVAPDFETFIRGLISKD